MTSDERREWIKTLKVGDEVCFSRRTLSNNYDIAKVDKVTPTGRIKIGTITFDNLGYEMGVDSHSWRGRRYLEPLTNEIRNKVKKEYLVKKLQNMDLSKLSLEQLEGISNIVNAQSQ